MSEKCSERAVELSALATCAEGSGHCQGERELERSPAHVEGTNNSEPPMAAASRIVLIETCKDN